MIGTNLFGTALAFVAGAAVAALNYAASRYLLVRRPSLYAGMQVVCQFVQLAYLAAVFLLGGYTPWDRLWLLVGGGFGLTLPMFYFTYRLVKLNDSLHKTSRASGTPRK